jgi:IPT/TIG domain
LTGKAPIKLTGLDMTRTTHRSTRRPCLNAARTLVLAAACAALTVAAGRTVSAQAAPVSISSVYPSSGPVGTRVTVAGKGFSATSNLVHFGQSVFLAPATDDGTAIVHTIPATAGPCEPPKMCPAAAQPVAPGSYPIFVTNDKGQSSNTLLFTVTR